MEYEVYNESTAEFGAWSLLSEAPDAVQAKARAILSERGYGEEAIRQASGKAVGEIDQIAAAKILDAWAAYESFDPERVCVEAAAWLLVTEDGRQGVKETHLFEDVESPCGFSWMTSTYGFSEALTGASPHGPGPTTSPAGTWIEDDGSCFWGYGEATDLFGEEPGFPHCLCEAERDASGRVAAYYVPEHEAIRVAPEFLDDLGVEWPGPQSRTATDVEIGRWKRLAADGYWERRDKAQFPDIVHAIDVVGLEAGKSVFKGGRYDVCLNVSGDAGGRPAVFAEVVDSQSNALVCKAPPEHAASSEPRDVRAAAHAAASALFGEAKAKGLFESIRCLYADGGSVSEYAEARKAYDQRPRRGVKTLGDAPSPATDLESMRAQARDKAPQPAKSKSRR